MSPMKNEIVSFEMKPMGPSVGLRISEIKEGFDGYVIKWEPPREYVHEIEQYVIWFKEIDTLQWAILNRKRKIMPKTTNFFAGNLKAGQTYLFCVVAHKIRSSASSPVVSPLVQLAVPNREYRSNINIVIIGLILFSIALICTCKMLAT